jgi:predicted GNAT family acetyltransferase
MGAIKASDAIAVERGLLKFRAPRSRLQDRCEDARLPDPAHPLDRPVWGSLIAGWSKLALRSGAALRLAPEYGPFAAPPEITPAGLEDLAGLDPGADGLWLIEPDAVPAPAGLAVAVSARGVQMTAAAITPGEAAFEVVPLGEPDGPEMLALARLTQPGPFAARTHALGGFIGVKRNGRLVAMAGERMRPDGFCEVSGVCTHPEHRGRGYASGLMRIVARRILGRGETPFLHTYETNTGAIALYGTLGFRLRRKLVLTVLKRA